VTTAMPTAQKPFEPGVCHLCGRILDKDLDLEELPVGNDLVAPASASHANICCYCERLLSTGIAASALEQDVLAFLSPSDAEPPPPATAPSLVIVQSRREVRLPTTSLVYLGRRDEEQRIYPDVDLTPDSAVACGVSRRHARIHLRDDGVYIEDQGSTNGTFINGERLFPSRLYPLEHGDMLQLGQLKLAVIFPQGAVAAQPLVNQSAERDGLPARVDGSLH
jgi:hypothetical protein